MSAVGRRYAKALLDLAEERGEADAVGRSLADLLETWRGNRELREVFENPACTQEMRHGVVRAIASRSGWSKLLENTLLLLSDRRRMAFVPDLSESYALMAEERAGRVRAEVVSASAMPESYFAQLQKALEDVTGKQVVIVKREDPSLIGGVVARVGDKVFDGSLKTRLAELKDELLSR